MPFFQENTSNPIRGILVIALLWLSIGLNHVYAQVPSYIPTNGLVGWWPLDGTGNDLVNQNNFSIYGPTGGVNRFGISNGCFDFNGTNLNAQYLETTNISSFFTSNYTYSGWFSTDIIRPNTGGLTWPDQGIICLGPSNYSTGNSVHIALLESSLFASHWTSNTSWVGPSTGNGTIQVNQWYHIVVSYNSGISKIYLNGQLISQLAIPISYSQSVKLIIGGNAETPNGSVRSGFDGKIDDIGFWSRALSQSEITALYNAQSTSPCTANIITQDTTICLGSSVTLRAPALTTTTVPSAGNCSNGIGTWEQLFTSAQLSGYSINRTNGYAFDTATGIYYSVSGSTTLKLDLVNKTITPFTQSGQNSSFSHGIFNYLDQKLYAHRVGRDVVYNVPKAGGTWTVYGSGSFDANSYGSQPFYDAQNNRVGFFGGYGFYSVKNWVYESTSTGWVNPYANNNNCNPARRNATGIAPSKDYKKMYIFSGAGNCNGSQTATSCTLGQAWASDVGKWCWLQDLYEYDFTTNSFTTILPTASPSISKEGSFAYNYDTDVFYILGGFTPPATYSATWGNTTPYTNTVLMMDRGAGATSFSQVSICGTPPPVGTVSSSQGMAFYDGPRDRIIWMRPDGIWALNLNTSTTSTTSSRIWSTGDTTQTTVVTPTQTTDYILTITQNGVSCNDTVTIYVNNPSISSSQTSFCQPGDSILLWTPNSNHQVVPPACSSGYVGTLPSYVAGQSITGYTYSGTYNGHYYYQANNPSSWLDAANSAKNAGGHLVCIDDASEQTFVQNLSTSNMWIGYYRTSNADPWKWVNCQNTTYTNWRSGEPGSNEHYTHILTNACFGPDQWNNLDNISTNGVCYSNCYGILEIDPSLNITPSNVQTLSWSTGQTGDSVWVTPNFTTTYTVTSVLNGVTCTKDVTITRNSPQIIPSDSVICAGGAVTLTAGGSIQFNGSSGFISFPNSGPTGQNPRSFSMWFKTNSATEMDLLGYGTRSCTQALELKLNDNLNYSASYNNNPCTLLQGVSTNFECHGSNWATNINDGQWHHVVYVLGESGNYSYSNIKAYVDGVLISNNPGCFHNWGGWTYNTGSTNPMVIGKRFDGNQHYFNGNIDEVSIWNAALSPSQVVNLYQNGVNLSSPGIFSYYDFNSIVNGQVLDLVGSNHGNVQSGAILSPLQAGSGSREFQWSTGDTTPSITVNPSQTTTYWLTSTIDGVSCSDTLQITVLNPVINATINTICSPGDSLLLYTTPLNPPSYDTTYIPGALVNQVTKNVTQNWQVDWPVSAGSWYFLEVSGMYHFTSCVNERDAAFWTNATCNGTKSLQPYNLHCNGGFSSWWIADSCNQRPVNDSYNPLHSYLYRVKANDGSLTLKYYDDYFGDNGGQLTFKLFNASTSIVPKIDSSRYWSTGQYTDSIWVKPLQTTTYALTQTLNGIQCTDSITISVNPVQILSQDTVLCVGSSTSLSIANSSSRIWSTGDTTSQIIVSPSQTTKYWVQSSLNGQTCSDSITVHVIDASIQSSSNFVCSPGDSVLIWTSSNSSNSTANTCFPPNATLSNGLLAWYPFCGNPNDASGNGNHALVFGATLAPDRFGTPLSSYDFDGVDDHLRATVANLPKGNAPRSFAAWVFSDGLNANGTSGTIYHHGSISYRQRDCLLRFTNQNLSHIGEGYDFSGGNLPNGSWQHVVFTHDGTTAKIYVDGVLRSQSNRNYNTANGDLFLGFNNSSSHWNGERFNGRIDDFGAWNRALTAVEIQQLMASATNLTTWNSGSTNDSIWVTPNQTTTYTVQKTQLGQTCIDSITIYVASAQINASDTTICAGSSATLSVSNAGLAQSYLWSTGDTSAQITVAPNQTSVYSLTTTLPNGLQCLDSVRINVNNAGINWSDTVICAAGDSILLWVPYQNAGILPGNWASGQSSFYATNFNSGIDPAWSSPTGPLPFAGNRVGPFGAGTLQLNLNNLPCHDSLRFNGLLQLAGTWDGNGNHCCGPDVFNVIVDGSTVFSTTFTLTQWAGNYQSYPAQYNPNNVVNNIQGTGSVGNNSYLLSFNFPHTGNSIEFKLAQPASQGAADESWYFDDFNLELFECGAGGASIWSTGQGGDSIWVKPQQTTTYWVKRWMQGVECSDTVTIHVSNIQQTFNPFTDTLVVCNGGSTILHAGPNYPYYSWNGGSSDSIKTISSSGTHWVTVTDSLGCQATDTVWVYFSDLTVNLLKINDVSCFGGSNAAASLSISGGQSPYAITWSTGQTGLLGLSNLSAGVYWVSIVDALGCTRSDTVGIGQPTAPLTASLIVTNVSCYGGSNGSIVASVSGGTGPYNYLWNTSPALTTANATSLSVGSYTLTITDSKGCILVVSASVTQPAAPLSASISATNVLCFGSATGSATAAPAGGTAPYTYTWNTTPVQNGSTATGLTSGTYSVLITDSKNCQTTKTVTITQPAAALSGAVSTTSVSCFGGSNGTATVSATGGSGPYSYSWSTFPSQTSATATNLPAGTYTVQIIDANNCVTTRTATVTQPGSALSVVPSSTPVSCYGDATGSATVNAFGGTAPYTYQWTTIPGNVSNTAQNISAGSYPVVVTDANGCIQQTTIVVTQPNAPLSGTLNVTHVSCFGDASGVITATVNGGTSPYTYSWPTITGLTSNNATNLISGAYTVLITDARGCQLALSTTVTQPAAPIQLSISGQGSLCYGDATGFAQVTATGGTAPYTYSWNSTPPQTTAAAINLIAGNYTCTVTDANGCIDSTGITLGQPLPLTGSTVVNDVSCRGAHDGSIQIAISGGTGNYSVSWPNGSTSLNRYQLGPGSYSYTITDENNCQFIGTAVVNEPSAFTITVDTISPKCTSTEDGKAVITATGGNGGIKYFINGQEFNGIADGLGVYPYAITILDQNGCDTSFLVDLEPVYEPCVEIPNWFSPNGNGENEIWIIQGFELEKLELVVFNVWGQVIYQTSSDNYIPWDGTYKGDPLPNGDYYYVMTSSDDRKYYSGYVTILR